MKLRPINRINGNMDYWYGFWALSVYALRLLPTTHIFNIHNIKENDMKLLLTLITATFLITNTAKAAPETYEFDKAHTQILFFVDHLGFSMSQGEFHDYDGKVVFDQTNPTESMVEVTIQTDSIDMDDKKWDKHMKNEDFFDVKQYPTMTFKSTSIKKTGENTANIIGDLKILDVTRPVILKTTFNKADIHPYSKRYVAGFSATTDIKRSDFGMDYGLPGIGDTVEIRLEVEAMRLEKEEGK